MNKKWVGGLLVVIFIVVVCDFWLMDIAWKAGYGAAVGYMTKIMDAQIKSDSTVSQVWLIDADTNVFVLSAKYRKLK